MSYQESFFPESAFGGFTRLDGSIQFYSRVNALLKANSTIVDIGCGRGAFGEDVCEIRRKLRTFKGKCRHVIGMDVDPLAKHNPHIDEFRLINEMRFPVDDATVDMVVADHVLEHIEDPAIFIAECSRILKVGGFLCARTPNAYGYVALISRLLPNRMHSKVTNSVQSGRNPIDVFPTYYRCNTRRSIQRFLRANSLEGCVFGYEAEPSYLEFSKMFYWLGVMHQKLAPEMFRLSLFCFAQKMPK